MCVCVCVYDAAPEVEPLGSWKKRARACPDDQDAVAIRINPTVVCRSGGRGGGGVGRGWPSHDPDNDPPGSITQDPGRRAKEPAGTGRMMAEEEEEGEGEGIEEGDCVSERQRWDGGSGNGGKPSWER